MLPGLLSSFLYFPVFVFLCIVFFLLPGTYLLRKTKLQTPFWDSIILGTVLGYVLFTILGYFFLLINSPILILIFYGGFFYFTRHFPITIVNDLRRSSFSSVLTVILILGVLFQISVNFPSGLLTDQGLIFYASHGHDGPWHLALINELQKGFPFQNPSFAGERLVNYHFFSDISLAYFNLLFKISSLDLYFRFFPILFATLLGGSAFILAYRNTSSFSAGIWALFFTQFAGSFGYIVTLKHNLTIGGESLFWGTQIHSSVGNPPQIISSIIILVILYLFLNFKNWDRLLLFLLVLLIGSLAVFKVYASVVVLGSLLVVGAWIMIRERKARVLLLAICSGILSALLYLPNTSGTTGFLIFEPWWYIRTMVVVPGRLDWVDLELRRQTYFVENNWKRIYQLETMAFLIFFFGNLGMRFLGLLTFAKFAKSITSNYFNLLFVLIIVSSLVLPLLFLQKGVASNTSQFLQYFLLLFGIAAGISTSQLLSLVKVNSFKVALSGIIIVLAVPTQVALLGDFYSRPPIAKVSQLELQALSTLKSDPQNKSILTPPYKKLDKNTSGIPDIWNWFDTSYVAAFSGKQVYFTDKEQVDIMGYKYQERENIQKNIFEESDPKVFADKLQGNNIGYIYFPKQLFPAVDLNKTNLKLFYKNSEIEIWSTN